MTIDLTKAKPGWIAHFRCGGSAKITYIQDTDPSKKVIFLSFVDKNYSELRYYTDGVYACSFHPFSIIRLEQPAFDWATAEIGMAFEFNGRVLWFIADPCPKITILSNVHPQETFSSRHIEQLDKINLTRAPEHDIEVPS